MTPTEALAAMQEALARVDAAADPEWKDLAEAAVLATAISKVDFISDDVWDVGELPATREDRALGPVFLRLKRSGAICKTGEMRPSKRSHLSAKPVWTLA